jgi:hypothetical protein
MSVHSWRELPRTVTHLIGASPDFERRFIATLNNPDTNAGTVIATIGCTHGSSHPEYPFARCYEVEVNEAFEDNRYWHEAIARYKVPAAQELNIDLLPWLRPDVWKFQTQGVSVPALYYYDGTTQEPLTNSAGDYFEGLTVDEAQQKVTIQSNRQNFPSALAAAVTNCVNDGITKLQRVGRAEIYLRKLGYRNLRVRSEGETARIELPPEKIQEFVINTDLSQVVKAFQDYGFSYVTLDLEGYRSGKLNQVLGSLAIPVAEIVG